MSADHYTKLKIESAKSEIDFDDRLPVKDDDYNDDDVAAHATFLEESSLPIVNTQQSSWISMPTVGAFANINFFAAM